MNKKYSIKKHVFQMLKLFSTVTVSAAFFLIIFPFMLKGDYILLRTPFLKFGLTISPILFIVSILLDRLNVKLKNCGITVTGSSIVYDGLFKSKSFNYNSISSFKYVKKIPFKKYGIIKFNEDKILLPFYIENLPELIRDIRKALNLISKNDVYTTNNIIDFDIMARYNELMSQMMFKSVPYLITAFFIVLSIDIVVLLHFWEIPLIFGLLWIIQSFFYPGAAYLISYTFISEKIKESIKRNPEISRLPDFSSVFIYSGLIFSIFYLISGIALRYFVYTHWTRL